ncbi:hypothetical protein [Yersinia enterocolitica]|uniref:hypothetical protein n=1 Tax=Yersinia enterocolitica TaxID=630 RepID=UPI0033000BED|nr:hypothetical protein [Yersinia enterocolitica]
MDCLQVTGKASTKRHSDSVDLYDETLLGRQERHQFIVGFAGAAVKDLSDKMTSDEFQHLIMLEMMGNDEITNKYLSSLQDKYAPDTGSTPNIGKDMTDEQKKELGGSGSGTPGGHRPEDEEAGRNSNSPSDPKSRGQHEEYVDSLRATMEKPNVKDGNLKNIIDDLYRPNAKVGSGDCIIGYPDNNGTG